MPTSKKRCRTTSIRANFNQAFKTMHMFNQRHTKNSWSNPPLLESIHAPPAGMKGPHIFHSHFLTAKSFAMIFFIIIVCLLFVVNSLLFFFAPVTMEDPPPIIYPLDGPAGPVEIDYEDILIEIDQCINSQNLQLLHTRILIFKACYPDESNLTNAILTAFNLKEQTINAAEKAGR